LKNATELFLNGYDVARPDVGELLWALSKS